MKNNITHILVALVLVVLLILLTDPFMLWMPPLAAMAALLALAVFACIWTGFVMRESVGDEREALHRMRAGHIAYLSGIGVLTLGLVMQGFIDHHIDPWIGTALAVMVISKLGTRIYSDTNQ